MHGEHRERRGEPRCFRLPVAEQRGRHHEQVRRPRPRLLDQEQREDLDGLAEPHVVGQADAEPEAARHREPPEAHRLVGAQRGAQPLARLDRRQPVRSAQPGQHGGQLRPRLDPGRARHFLVHRLRRRSRQEPHPVEERQPIAGVSLHLAPVSEHVAQPVAIDLDPLAAHQRQPLLAGQHRLDLLGGERLAVECHLHREREQLVRRQLPGRASDPDPHLGGRRPARAPPVGHPHHDARLLERRDLAQEPVRLGRRPRQRVIEVLALEELGHQLALLRRPLDRHQERQQASPVPLRRRLGQRARQGRVLDAALAAGAERMRRQERERRLGIGAVLRQVKADLADRVPRPAVRPQELLHRPAEARHLTAQRLGRLRPQRAHHLAIQILRPVERRRALDQRRDLLLARVQRGSFAQPLQLWLRHHPRHHALADVAHPPERRLQRRGRMVKPHIDDGVPGPARRRRLQRRPLHRRQPILPLAARLDPQRAARPQRRRQRRLHLALRGHLHRAQQSTPPP